MSVHWLLLTGIRWPSFFLPVSGKQRFGVLRRRRISYVSLNLDGNGRLVISLPVLASSIICLEQIGKHSGMDLTVRVKGDLEVDEHHTIEDTAIALGECIYQALGSKRGIERYGYALAYG